ncbi:SDR family NAD(P)-dependent oxidoreductase [Paenibacillus harenae]|uniref:SDR family NAD(P)-dependent oxidoreductase n=1 Tax=Paenibacillus harenae TaxID=306543 RepID=UPI002792CCF9|nr:SDR family NAD(P)-dependent oxidoreductase [Paenibacillus harenae]MDQ0059020.1 acyl transferase domain-containing protein/acyl carrier protein [Paenibacillus harenae]
MNGKRELNQLLNQIRNGQMSPTEGLKQFEALRSPSGRLYYRPIWEAGTLPSARLSVSGPVLIMEREDDILAMLGSDSNVTTIRVKPGRSFREADPATFEINPRSAEDFRQLAQLLAQRGLLPTTIIHHWAVDYDEQSEAGLAEGLDFGFYSVYFLTQAFMKLHAKFQMLFVFPAGDGKPLYPALQGFARSLFVENPSIQIKTVTYSERLRLEWLAHELQANDTQVHYAEGMRWIRRLQETEASKTGELPLKEQGVYLITGGAGGLGFIFAQYLAKRYRARLVLSGRSAVNEAISDQIRRLEADGARVLYVQGDISKREHAEKLVKAAKANFGVLNGVIHAAGIVQDAFLLKKTESEIKAVLAPKVFGTSWLDEWTANEPLDFFVLFSSISSELGNAGQTDYTFGNSFMDYFAAKRDSLVAVKKRFGRTLSLNWPYWEEGGMSVATETVEEMKLSAGIMPMSTAVGIEAFEDGLRSESTQWLVAEGDVSLIRRRVSQSFESKPAEVQQERASAIQRSDTLAPPVPLVSDEAFLQGTIDFLKKVLSEELGVSADRIKPKEPFEKYGIDSVMVMGLNRVLEEQFGSLSKTLFYEYQNIAELAGYFAESHHDRLRNKIAEFASASTAAAATAKTGLEQGLKQDLKQALASSDKPTTKTTDRKGRGRFIQHAKSISAKTESDPMDIAIIGVAGRYPQADNLQQFWENLKSGKDSITEVPAERWDQAAFFDADKSKKGKSYTKWGGFVNDVDKFDPLFFNISPKEAEMTDPQERLFLETVYHMLEDAGYTKSKIEKRPIGVYVGVMYGEYQLYGAEQAKKGHIIGVSTSYASIANRISYNFNLSGPSLALDTMCSSSLTSIHLASESLRRGETEMAIAGGVNVSIHPNKYLVLAQGRYASSDGRCRSFGEGGDGYVPGEGVGAVLLKPLSKAIEDGDHIHAVIKGTSINHGGKTNGYTVPNPNAQSAVIADALQKAGVDAKTISYMEAHGTGTSLGDPIEITGLAKAFGHRADEQPFCSIGSAKSNIGHLESAAGIAGITKVLLQMKHRQLVPSLHADTVNPNIDFEQTPFYLQRELADWHQPVMIRNGREITVPRRAGVSSFGAGGSNAHIVLEEYAPSSIPRRPFVPAESQLIVFSAKNQDRLKELVRRMSDFLSRQSGAAIPDLIDIAYTLQVGRESLDERLAIKAASLDELLASMRFYLEGQPVPGLISGRARRGTELAVNDEEGDAVDRIARRWVYGEEIDWELNYSGHESQRSPRRVPLPGYPFARERYWVPEPEGLKPAIYGDGQARLHAMIDANVSTLDEQRFEKRFDSSDFYVRDHAVGGRMVLPGAACLEMARAAGQLSYRGQMVAVIKNMSWNSPIIVPDDGQDVFVSLYPAANGVEFEVTTSTGGNDEPLVHAEGQLEYGSAAPIEPLDLGSIRRRCPQVRNHEQFYALYASSRFQYGTSMRTVQQTARGGKEILARLQSADEYREETEEFNLHPAQLDGAFQSLLGLIAEDELTPIAYLPYAIGKLELFAPLTSACYVYACEREEPENGVREFDMMLTDEAGHVLVSVHQLRMRALSSASALTNAAEKLETISFRQLWEPLDQTIEAESLGRVLLLAQDEALLQDMKRYAAAVTAVQSGETFEQKAVDRFTIRMDRAEDYERLVGMLSKTDRLPDTIIHTGAAGSFSPNKEELQARMTQGIESLLYLTQALMKERGQGRTRLLYVYSGNGEQQPQHAAIAGFLKSLRQENPNWSGATIDLGSVPTNAEWIRILRKETAAQDVEVRYASGSRFVKRLREVTEPPLTGTAAIMRENGVYLITGGAGGLGLMFADYLARRYKARLVLAGRSALHAGMEQKLSDLRSLGSEVLYVQADVADRQQAERLIEAVKAQFGALHGIIHSAGIVRDSLIMKKSRHEMAEVLGPKIYGAVNLDEATAAEPLDWFVMFSSLSGVLGNIGQCDYAYGNQFLDEFAVLRETQRSKGNRSGRTLSLNWPLWKEGGMQVAPSVLETMKRTAGFIPMSAASGYEVFETALASGLPQWIALEGEAEKIRTYLLSGASAAGSQTAVVQPGGQQSAQLSSEKDDALLLEKGVSFLKEIVSKEIRLPAARIDEHEALDVYGLDSVMIMALTRELESRFGELSKTLFFEYRTLAELTLYFVIEHRDKLMARTGLSRQEKQAAVVSAGSESAQLQPPAKSERKPRSNRQRFPGAADQAASEEQAVAIIGVAGRYPEADDLESYWENLKAGRDSIGEIPSDRWDHSAYYEAGQVKGKSRSKWGGFLDDADKFDPLFFQISPREAELLDPQERLFLMTVHQALEDGGYTKQRLSGKDVGVYVGVMYSEYQLYGAQETVSGNTMALGSSYASIANRVSYFYDLQGPSLALDTMCSSSLTAIHLACESLLRGESEMAIAGGVNLSLHVNKYLLLSQNNFLASDGRCRSFGDGGDGYVPGEGVGAVILKPLKQAIEDGDPIYAVIKGTAVNHGGKTNGYTVPNPHAQTRVIDKALKKAKVDARSISYLEAHGTGTPLGDPIEVSGLVKAFGGTEERQYCAIGSVKSNIGHLESAAGIAALTKVLLQMKHGMLAPSLHADVLNSNIRFEDTPFYVQRELSEWKRPVLMENGREMVIPRRAGVSSFGAGGSNAHIIVEEFVNQAAVSAESDNKPHIIVLSARNEDRLRAYAGKLAAFLSEAPETTANQDAHAATANEIEKEVLTLIAEGLSVGVDEIAAATDVSELGFDELKLTQIAIRLNEVYSLNVTPDRLAEHATVNNLTGHVIHTLNKNRKFIEDKPSSKTKPGLADITWTLQYGREPMDERLALVVSSVSELASKMRQYASGKEVDGLYEGNVKADAEKHRVLLEGAEGKLFLKSLIENQKLDKMANLWVSGVVIDWQELRVSKGRIVSLPSYPFVRDRYWAPTGLSARSASIAAQPVQAAPKQKERLLLVKSWREQKASAALTKLPGTIFILANAETLDTAGRFLQGTASAKVIVLQNAADAVEGRKAAQQYLGREESVSGLIDLSDLHGVPQHKLKPSLGKFAFVQELIKQHRSNDLRMIHITNGLQSFKGASSSLAGADMAGLMRMLHSEYRKVISTTIDIDYSYRDEAKLRELVLTEWAASVLDNEICLRQNRRYLPQLEQASAEMAEPYRLDAQLGYIVTGGTRGIGLEAARHLVRKGARKLVLMGLQAYPPRGEWEMLLQSESISEAMSQRLQNIMELEKSGVEVQIYAGSLTDRDRLTELFREVRERFGGIGGVIHCAGVASGENPAFMNKSAEEMSRVFEPKIGGLQVLHDLLANDELRFFLLFSSVSGLLPALAAGGSDYAAANSFMDFFAAYQRSQGFSSYQSLQWPNWKEVGMGEAAGKVYTQLGLELLTTQEGLSLLDQALTYRDTACVMPAVVRPNDFEASVLLHARHAAEKQQQRPSPTPSSVKSGGASGYSSVSKLKELFSNELKIPQEQMEIHTPFSDFGVDSVLLAELVLRIEGWLKVKLDPGLLLEYPTLSQLTRYLDTHFETGKGAEPEGNGLQEHKLRIDEPKEYEAHKAERDAAAPFVPTAAVQPGRQQVAVIGMACHFPGAEDKDAYWSNLIHGLSSVTEVPKSRWDADQFYASAHTSGKTVSKWGGFLDNIEAFDPGYFQISEEDAPYIDPLVRQFLEVSVQTVRDAGYNHKELWNRKIGVFVGSRVSNFSDKLGKPSKNTIIGIGQNFIAAHCSHFFNWKGPNLVVDTACSSSLVSLHLACQSLMNGESEMALAGGVDILLDEKPYLVLSEGRGLSPDGKCHTFDEKANGFVPGEGSGAVLLKPLDQALRDGDRIYAVIDATAVNNDGHTMGITTPNPEAQYSVIREAMQRGGIDARSVSYIETHGTGTMIGDPIELKALTRVFHEYSEDRQYCGVGSVKTNFGHTLSAAGIASFIKVALAIKNKQLPPTLNCERPNPRFEFEASPFYPVQALRDWLPDQGVRRAGISGFGFGGTNAHVIVSEGDPDVLNHYVPVRNPLEPVVFNRKRYWFNEEQETKAQPSMLRLERLR